MPFLLYAWYGTTPAPVNTNTLRFSKDGRNYKNDDDDDDDGGGGGGDMIRYGGGDMIRWWWW